MTLVKLDSGDYINTEAVDSIKSGDDPYLVMRCGDVISITTTDRDRIVEAMSGTAVTLPLFHHQDGLKPFSADDFKISDKS
jgi:hypothetical protein